MLPHPELMDEGVAREVITRFQQLRKKAGLVPTDEVLMRYRVVADADGVGFGRLVAAWEDMFVGALRARPVEVGGDGYGGGGSVIVEEECSVGGLVLGLQLVKI